jgi:hypothetical protein
MRWEKLTSFFYLSSPSWGDNIITPNEELQNKFIFENLVAMV